MHFDRIIRHEINYVQDTYLVHPAAESSREQQFEEYEWLVEEVDRLQEAAGAGNPCKQHLDAGAGGTELPLDAAEERHDAERRYAVRSALLHRGRRSAGRREAQIRTGSQVVHRPAPQHEFRSCEKPVGADTGDLRSEGERNDGFVEESEQFGHRGKYSRRGGSEEDEERVGGGGAGHGLKFTPQPGLSQPPGVGVSGVGLFHVFPKMSFLWNHTVMAVHLFVCIFINLRR